MDVHKWISFQELATRRVSRGEGDGCSWDLGGFLAAGGGGRGGGDLHEFRRRGDVGGLDLGRLDRFDELLELGEPPLVGGGGVGVFDGFGAPVGVVLVVVVLADEGEFDLFARARLEEILGSLPHGADGGQGEDVEQRERYHAQERRSATRTHGCERRRRRRRKVDAAV